MPTSEAGTTVSAETAADRQRLMPLPIKASLIQQMEY